MRHTDLFYLMALQNVAGIGQVNARKLISHFGSAAAVLKAKPHQISNVEGIGRVRANAFNTPNLAAETEAELAFIEANGIKAIPYDSPDFPERLQHCPDAPLVLFTKGNIDLAGRHVISVVGTRQITQHGRDFCRRLIEELAPLDPVIVSGFAFGVDIAAHQAAIENGLQTVAVLAHGLNQIYPRAHSRYVPQVEANGGFITEFRSSSFPAPAQFVSRNRIVAGISEATIVVESAQKGGSLVTATMANDYNREVFAVPGRTTDQYSEGCNNLIKTQKAHLLTSAADLVYMLNWDLQKRPKVQQHELFASLDPEQQTIYHLLRKEGKMLLDLIALECQLPIPKLSGLLLAMELKGAIRPLPGKLFEAI